MNPKLIIGIAALVFGIGLQVFASKKSEVKEDGDKDDTPDVEPEPDIVPPVESPVPDDLGNPEAPVLTALEDKLDEVLTRFNASEDDGDDELDNEEASSE